MKSTNQFPMILGLFVLILSAITIAVILVVDQFGQKEEDHQQITGELLQGKSTAVRTLEHSEPQIQKQILNGEFVKNALVKFYLQNSDQPIFTMLETYDKAIESDILQDNTVYRTLVTHYYDQIDVEVDADNFDQAFSLLETLQKKYPNSIELDDKYREIQNRKQLRLASLTQQYMECLDQTLAALLERTHCMAEARQKIEHVGIEHSLPRDPNLPAMYVEEIKHAIKEKNYEYAEKVLLDWKNLLPAPDQEREALQNSLIIQQKLEGIKADLVSEDQEKINDRISQLIATPHLEKEVLEQPEIRNSLVNYHINEALALISQTEEVTLDPKTEGNLKKILAVADQKRTQPQAVPWFSDESMPHLMGETDVYLTTQSHFDVATLLQVCQEHYKANNLTTGPSGTALDCYRTVLKQEPGNAEALKGLEAIENRYRAWAETALRQNQLEKVKTYLNALKNVNPDSQHIVELKERLNAKMIRQKPKSSQLKTVETPSQCEGCNCSLLLRQLSIGINPLTPKQNRFFQTQCR